MKARLLGVGAVLLLATSLSPRLAGVPGIEYVPYGRGPATRSGTNVLEQLWGHTPTHYGT